MTGIIGRSGKEQSWREINGEEMLGDKQGQHKAGHDRGAG